MKNINSVLKTQQRQMLLLKKTNKIALSSNGDIDSIDSIETYTYGTSKVLISEKEEFRCNNIIKRYK